MTIHRHDHLATGVFLFAVILAGCSGNGSGGSSPTASSAAATAGVTNLGEPSAATETPYFLEHFDGTALDSGRWDTSALTGGIRWCTDPPLSSQGVWQDPSLEPFKGVGLNVPYGTAEVREGRLELRAGHIAAFPFLVAGGTGQPSPIPPTGDFDVELRVRFPFADVNGVEIELGRWAGLAEPTPFSSISIAFAVRIGIRAPSYGNPVLSLADLVNVPIDLPEFDPVGWHVYRMEYRDGNGTLFVDGNQVVGPLPLAARPDVICIGNCIFTWWRPYYGWSSIDVDSIRVTALSQMREIAIDVKPGDEGPAPINPRSEGTVPVVLLGSAGFDASTVDPSTIRMAGATVAVRKNGSFHAAMEDVNGDGDSDLVVHVVNREIDLTADATEVVLTGTTFDGEAVIGRHAVRIVP